MLDGWLQKNKLASLEEIASKEQLEPFVIQSLYTKDTAKILDVPYLPPQPFLDAGEEYRHSSLFKEQVEESLKNASGLVYLCENLEVDLTHFASIDFSILKTFLNLSQWKSSYKKFLSATETSFFIEDANLQEIPNHTSRGLSAKDLVEAGTNKTIELASVLYRLCQVIEAKMDLTKIHFTFYNDSNFSLDIAKIRAFRFLYFQLLKTYGLEPKSPHIHIRTNPHIYTINEPWMNVKRQGTAVFSALVTNVQSISLPAFDFRQQVEEVDSSRVSRNLIAILKEESHLWDVYDPAKGSFLFESLTHDMAEAAWVLLQSGSEDIFKEETQKVKNQRLQLYKNKNLDLVGTTVFAAKDFKTPTDAKYLDGQIV